MKIQGLSLRDFLTFQFFPDDAPKIRGAISIGLCPSNHGELHKGVLALLLTMIVVEA